MTDATEINGKTWNATLKLHQRLVGGRDIPEMLALIAEGARLDVQNAEKMTPLILAAANSLTPVVKAMLDCGRDAEIDAQDDHGWTALITAAHRGNADCVKLLLDAGADVTIKDQMGRDALYYARGSKDTEKIGLISMAAGEAAFVNSATITAKSIAVRKPLKIKP